MSDLSRARDWMYAEIRKAEKARSDLDVATKHYEKRAAESRLKLAEAVSLVTILELTLVKLTDEIDK